MLDSLPAVKRKSQSSREVSKVRFRFLLPWGTGDYISESLPQHLKEKTQEAQWFVGRICKFSVERWDFSQYVPLNSRVLKRIMGNEYREIINALVSAGIVEQYKNSYEVGVISKQFRLGIDLQIAAKEHEPYWANCTKRRLHMAILRFLDESQGRVTAIDRKLRAIWRQVEIRSDDAWEIVDAIERDETTKDGSGKQAAWSVIALERGDREYKVDRYGRRHTNLTSLNSRLRTSLRWKGQSLQEVDIRTSQPVILATALRLASSVEWCSKMSKWLRVFSKYAERDQAMAGACMWTEKMQSECQQGLKTAKTLRDVSRMVVGWRAGVGKFEKSVCNGTLYDEMYFAVHGVPLPEEKRRSFKEVFFEKVFYGQAKEPSEVKKAFQKAFPEVFSIIQKLKEPCWRAFPCLMQKIESVFVIERAAKRFLEERPGQPILTIHDSFMVLPADADFAERCIIEAFQEAGVTPTIKRK